LYLAGLKEKAMHKLKFIFFMVFVALVAACKKDDGNDVETVPPRSLTEVAIENDADIQDFLKTHFYNYDEFENPPADFDYQIRIDTIAGANADKTPMLQDTKSISITVSSDDFALSVDETYKHKLYYLIAKQGSGDNPTVADSVYVRYRGTLLDGTEFDGAFQIPTWFDLAGLQGPLQGARGFTEGMPFLKTGGSVVEYPDGTFEVTDAGVGLIIMPSGLAYFNNARSNIPAYSPLMFAVNLVTKKTTDHDGDGIPSIMEDLNGDGYLFNDNTDEKEEKASGSFLRFVNYLDPDDDQDNTPTRDEIIIDDQGNITFPDTDNDGIPDYLDRDNP
jgi:FKBP-type peptidyl-prolyl cis-trans isomerase